MPQLTREYNIKARDFLRAGEGALQVKSTLKTFGFDSALIRRASVCAYESEMNVVMYGSDGTLSLNVDGEEIVIGNYRAISRDLKDGTEVTVADEDSAPGSDDA